MRHVLAELYRRDRVLTLAGWVFVALLAGMLLAASTDHRQVLGVNVWIKPIKFAASIAIYMWTLAWLMADARAPDWCKALIRWGVIVAMLVEIACIAGQSLRGVASHFNNRAPLDSAVFAAMGLAIVINTLFELMLFVLFLRRHPALPPAYVLGIRLGLAGALLSAAIGGVMLVNGGHTVGAMDGGPGLWLVNWSTQAGDLRVAHAMGLHALQILPITGYVLGRISNRRTSLAGTAAFALVYGAAGCWLYWQAALGHPLTSLWPLW
jgi:hypothetical protein